MLSSFKKQLEDAGYFVAQAREAQKAAEMEAAKCREDARVAADAKQKAEEDLRKVAQLKCQAEERAANEREAVQKEMDNRMAKAMKDVEARRKALEERTRIAEEALRMASTSDEDEMMVESQLRGREEGTRKAKNHTAPDVVMDSREDDTTTYREGNEEPEASMPGALLNSTIVQRREKGQEIGPRKSLQRTSGTLNAPNTNMVITTNCCIICATDLITKGRSRFVCAPYSQSNSVEETDRWSRTQTESKSPKRNSYVENRRTRRFYSMRRI
jgi:hypothetical protein